MHLVTAQEIGGSNPSEFTKMPIHYLNAVFLNAASVVAAVGVRIEGIRMKDQKPNYPYTLARFVPGKKRSYIVFYIWNKDKGKKERVRDYTIDQYRDRPDFDFYKSKFIEDINELLINGAYRTNHETPRKFRNTREAVDFFMQKRGKITRFRTIQGYKQCLLVFTG